MANYPNQVLTNDGLDALTEALAGKRLRFVRMAVGDGQQAGITPVQLQQRTSLINYVMDVPITDYRSVGEGRLSITGTLRSAEVTTGFHMSEIGLYVELDDVPPQILYSINNAGTDTDYIPDKNESTVVIQAIEVQVIISRATNVTVNVVLGEVTVDGENIGTGAGVFAQRSVNRLQFKSLRSSSGIRFSESADTIDLTVGDVDYNPTLPAGQGPSLVPTGTILPFGGYNPPVGFLRCDGNWYAKLQYPKLATVLADVYGATTDYFAVPDCRDRSLIGWLTWGIGASFGSNSPLIAWYQMPVHAHTVDIDHYHSITVNDHNHYDPTHAHWGGGGWHDHGPHSHSDTGHGHGTHTHYIGKYHGVQPGTTGEYSATGETDSTAAASTVPVGYANIAAAYAGDAWANVTATDYRTCGLYNAGQLGGTTSMVSAMAAGWNIRNTSYYGGDYTFDHYHPTLVVNFIIKT